MAATIEGELNAADVLLGPALGGPNPSAIALITDAFSLTYKDLNRQACRAGNAFRRLGAETGDRVLLLVDDRPEFFFTYLGAMKIGAVPVALSLRLSDEDLAYIVSDSDCKILVADNDFLPSVNEALAPEARPAMIVADRAADDLPLLGDLMAAESDDLATVKLGPDAMAFWMYTSGTTGKPKAVVHRQATVPTLTRYLGPLFGVGPGDKLFCSSKLFFAFSLGHILFAGLQLGAAMILRPGWPTAEAIADVAERHRPDVMFTVPAMYKNLLADGVAESPAFKNVRHFISAGERLSETLFERWQDATGQPIYEGIGATEATVMFIGNRPGDVAKGASGRPFPQTDVKLVDMDGNAIDEPNKAGVLWIRCPSLAVEYWNRPNKTADAFKDGWYCTGDMLSRDEGGRYHYQGRDDDMLKISGQWVSPAEIEEHVIQNPQITEAAVVGVENADGLTRLALCAVLRDNGIDTDRLEDAVCDHLKSSLAIYKCPRRFVYLDEFPKTATGKLQRFKLRQIAADTLSS